MGPRDRSGERRRDPSAVVLGGSLQTCTANPQIACVNRGTLLQLGLEMRGPYQYLLRSADRTMRRPRRGEIVQRGNQKYRS
jgi:hypothetical protein